MISTNLHTLRKLSKLTQEDVAEKLGISRQSVAKWESGESLPDITNCIALSELYNVTLDELVHHKDDFDGALIPPKGKHFFGTVCLNDRGQIVIPKKAREIFHLTPGENLLLLGDEEQGLAIVRSDDFFDNIKNLQMHVKK